MAQTMQTVKEATGIDMGEIVRANSIQAKTDRNINIMNQGEQPVNSEKEGGVNAMERVEGGYLIHEKSLNGEEVTHFRPDVTEEEKAIMKEKGQRLKTTNKKRVTRKSHPFFCCDANEKFMVAIQLG